MDLLVEARGSMNEPGYTGTLRKGEEPGTVVGELVDTWGWRLTLFGTLDRDTGTYTLTGTLGDTPPSLRLPGLEEPA